MFCFINCSFVAVRRWQKRCTYGLENETLKRGRSERLIDNNVDNTINKNAIQIILHFVIAFRKLPIEWKSFHSQLAEWIENVTRSGIELGLREREKELERWMNGGWTEVSEKFEAFIARTKAVSQSVVRVSISIKV